MLHLALLLALLATLLPRIHSAAQVPLDMPLFCVDDAVLGIFSPRLSCIGGAEALMAPARLAALGAAEMYRAHEAIAYDWFVRTSDNPYRRPCSDPAVRLEYIPLLPLHSTAAPLGSSADIGGPGNASYACSYAALVADIERYVAFRKPSARKAFAVAGTFNLRTEMGVRGMASQNRRGPQYDALTAFVTSTFLGHYERFPQCPDLLRKHWPGIVEMPYVPPSFFLPQPQGKQQAEQEQERKRDLPFLFVGRMWLFGPERVCSVRNAIAALPRGSVGASVVVVNTTDPHPPLLGPDAVNAAPLSPLVLKMYARAVFCLVSKADSYSSAALFVALDQGCIPVVVSDWLAPAFNWAVPWGQVAVRLAEQDFLASPDKALRTVQEQFADKAPAMREAGRQWRRLLSFRPAPSAALADLRQQTSHYLLPDPGPGTVVPALELLLLELLYHPGTKETPKSSSGAAPAETGLSCETPYHCPSAAFLLPPTTVAGLGPKGAGDERSYLCKHVHRFVGQYKMVFNQKCVRVLWPLRPGYFKPHDETRLSEQEKEFVTAFHKRGFSADLYPRSSANLTAAGGGQGRGGVVALADLL